MIHKHIFAAPRPGMTEAAFQRYWLDVHAVEYASKIAQVRKYKICTRIDWPGDEAAPLWSGLAEMWFQDEQEELAAVQSKEFLEGARLDEPRWAAFWKTLDLDTDQRVVVNRMPSESAPSAIKVVTLLKRRPGMSVEDYRAYHLDRHAPLLLECPGILRHDVCFTRDSGYTIGEPRFDSVSHTWFESLAALNRMIDSEQYRERVLPDRSTFLEPRYIFSLVVREHWVIGPEPRP